MKLNILAVASLPIRRLQGIDALPFDVGSQFGSQILRKGD